MRKAVKILLAVGVLVVAALVVLWLALDWIAESAIEHGATYALGVPTTVGDVDLSLLGGEVTIRELAVANPEGFQTPHMMRLDRLNVRVRPGSLMEDAVEVEQFVIEGLDVYIEQKIGKSNVSVILGNLEKFGTEGGGEKKEAGGKKLKVGHVQIRNVVAHVQVLPIGGQTSTLTVKVPEILLDDVTSDSGGGVVIAELAARLVPAVLAAILEKGKGVLPDDLAKDLGDGVGRTAQALGTGAGRLVNQVGKGVGGALKGLGKPLERFLPGRKGDADKEPSSP
jgi:hypothetical protein